MWILLFSLKMEKQKKNSISYDKILVLTIGDQMIFYDFLKKTNTNKNILDCIDKLKNVKLINFYVNDGECNEFHKDYEFLKILSKDDCFEFLKIVFDINNYEKYAKDNDVDCSRIIDIIRDIDNSDTNLNLIADNWHNKINDIENKSNLQTKVGKLILSPFIFAGVAICVGVGKLFEYPSEVYFSTRDIIKNISF